MLRLKNETLTRLYGAEPFNERAILDEYLGYAERIDPYIRDIYPIIQEALTRRQAHPPRRRAGRDARHRPRHLPVRDISSPTAGGALHRERHPALTITRTVGVFKAYTTRVGYGPFPTELTDALGDQLRELGAEYGTTTGRARRVGWFDAAVSRYAVAHQRHRRHGAAPRSTCSTPARDLKICTGYMSKGEYWDHPMANISHLKHFEPIYEELPGWMSPTRECRR